MFKFIHAADIHLDSPLRGLERYEGAPVDEIRGATRRAFERLVELAIQRQVDFVVVAGDLYDGDWKDHNTGLFFVSQMMHLREADIPVIMISGNHDAANRMTKTLRLPDNVELLSHKQAVTATSEKLASLGVALHGRSFANAAEYQNLARDYPHIREGMLNIGLLHTSLEGVEGHEPYAPCTIEELRQKQYDYWALGHVHARQIIGNDPPIVFSGNLQGRHARETGAKGCYLVTVDASRTFHPEFVALDAFRWETCRVQADEAQQADDVLALFTNELTQVMQRNAGMPLAIRVQVAGRCLPHENFHADPERWKNEMRAAAIDASGGNVWVEKVQFQTSPASEGLAEGRSDGPIGELLNCLLEISGDDGALSELAEELDDLKNKLPQELKRGEEKLALDDPATIREWLKEVEPMLLSRLGERP